MWFFEKIRGSLDNADDRPKGGLLSLVECARLLILILILVVVLVVELVAVLIVKALGLAGAVGDSIRNVAVAGVNRCLV